MSSRHPRWRRERKQKRRRQAVLLAQLRKQPHKPPLPSIFLTNARSLANEMDELQSEIAYYRHIRLRELTLSANPGISSSGWSRLAIAVAHSSQLRVLNLDYNPLGDQIAGMLAVAVASSRTLEVLDLEGTGLTNQSAQVFLDMVENYPTSLRVLVLAENDISPELQQQICDLLSEGEEDDELQPGTASNGALLPIRDKYQPNRDKYQPIRDKYQLPAWQPHSNSMPQMVVLSSGLGESLLAETQM